MNLYTFTQTLLHVLKKNNWFVKFQLKKKTNRVQRLFFVNKHVQKILCKNFEMLIMNCIYKINKYEMSLFVIMNFIALKTNFYINFAFLKSEKKTNFDWIIEQHKKLYKSLNLSNFVVIITNRNQTFLNVIEFNYFDVYNVFCVWHINKNVFKNCKPAFEIQKKWKKFLIVWHDVVYAHTSTKYDLIWKRMRIEYKNEYQKKIDYLLNT